MPKTAYWYLRVAVTFLSGFFTYFLVVFVARYLPPVSVFHLSRVASFPLAVAIGYLCATFVKYWWHIWKHRNGFLWRALHQIHHSPKRNELLTALYKHPLEPIVYGLIYLVVLQLFLGLDIPELAAVLTLLAVGELLQHVNLRMPRWLGYVLVTPDVHRVHHIRDYHWNNFSDFVLWDMMFGTYLNPRKPAAELGFDSDKEEKFFSMLAFQDVGAARLGRDGPVRKSWARKFVFASVLVLTLGASFASWQIFSRARSCHRCNLVLISVNSLRRDHMGVYGYSRPTTPAIDTWAKNALVFDNYFATSYLAPISEASVHTGLFPQTSGIINVNRVLPGDVMTLAEIAKANGYATAAVGTSPEFAHYDGLRASFSRGFDNYHVPVDRIDFSRRRTLDWREIKTFVGKNLNQPFFLWISVGEVHAPFGFRERNRFAEAGYQGPLRDVIFHSNLQYYYDGLLYNLFDPIKKFSIAYWHGIEKHMLHNTLRPPSATAKWPIKISSEDIEDVVNQYDNGVATADDEFNWLITGLKKAGILDRTVIVLQGEDGETLGERGYIAHYDIYDESMRVPLIISSPSLPGAQRVPELVSGVDLLPSLIRHLDMDPRITYPLDGKSFFDARTGAVKPTREDVYFARTPLWEQMLKTEEKDSPFDRFREADKNAGYMDHGIRDARSKLIHRAARVAEEKYSSWSYISGRPLVRQEYEFYDLLADPREQKPLAINSPEAFQLKAKLLAIESDLKARARSAAVVSETPADP